MGNISYTAHVSNKKSAITSKTKLAAVAKHNLRKYKSSDYSKDNIVIVYGTSNLIDDVKTVYHKEFDEALEEYNKKQTRPDRRIEDYFEHVAGKEQDMAVEIIIQIGDREFWKQYDDMKSYMKLSYQIMLDELRKRLPQFVVANAVVHLDEDSPHMDKNTHTISYSAGAIEDDEIKNNVVDILEGTMPAFDLRRRKYV